MLQKEPFPFKSAASKSCQNVVGKCRFLVGECRLWVGQCRLFVFILVSQNSKICKNALRQKHVSFAPKGAFGPNSTKKAYLGGLRYLRVCLCVRLCVCVSWTCLTGKNALMCPLAQHSNSTRTYLLPACHKCHLEIRSITTSSYLLPYVTPRKTLHAKPMPTLAQSGSRNMDSLVLCWNRSWCWNLYLRWLYRDDKPKGRNLFRVPPFGIQIEGTLPTKRYVFCWPPQYNQAPQKNASRGQYLVTSTGNI